MPVPPYRDGEGNEIYTAVFPNGQRHELIMSRETPFSMRTRVRVLLQAVVKNPSEALLNIKGGKTLWSSGMRSADEMNLEFPLWFATSKWYGLQINLEETEDGTFFKKSHERATSVTQVEAVVGQDSPAVFLNLMYDSPLVCWSRDKRAWSVSGVVLSNMYIVDEMRRQLLMYIGGLAGAVGMDTTPFDYDAVTLVGEIFVWRPARVFSAVRLHSVSLLKSLVPASRLQRKLYASRAFGNVSIQGQIPMVYWDGRDYPPYKGGEDCTEEQEGAIIDRTVYY